MFLYSCACRVSQTRNSYMVIRHLFSYLMSLGYSVSSGFSYEKIIVATSYSGIPDVEFFDSYRDVRNKCKHFTDCGYNLNLFKAISSVSDDTDRLQFFTDGKLMVLCPFDSFSELTSNDRFHKATISELTKNL